jgi:hypothetical protein
MIDKVGQPNALARGELAPFRPLGWQPDPLFCEWLAQHEHVLFRWTLQRAADVGGERRRAFAEVAVAVQRLRGRDGYIGWLFGAALRAALVQARAGGLPEAALAGLAPELRGVLRLVARRDLGADEAEALLAERISVVRGRLLQARLRP